MGVNTIGAEQETSESIVSESLLTCGLPKTDLAGEYLHSRGAKISSKAWPELRPAPHGIWWAQHRARPASFKHRTKPRTQYIMHCDPSPEPDMSPAL